jgi:hypothetical protein
MFPLSRKNSPIAQAEYGARIVMQLNLMAVAATTIQYDNNQNDVMFQQFAQLLNVFVLLQHNTI